MDDTLNKVLSLIKSNNIPKGKFLSDLKLGRSTISDWTNNKSVSYLKYLPQIAAYFNVSLDWLSGNEQKNKPITERDRLIEECLNIMDSLPEDLQKVAHEQLKALSAIADKNKKK